MKASPVVATDGEEGTETVEPAGWVSIGPNNVAGRVRAIIYDRFNEGTMYAGGVGGGLYISENAGNTWQEIDFSNGTCYSVTALAQGDDGAIYVGTGEGFYDDHFVAQNSQKTGLLGDGVFKVVKNEEGVFVGERIEGTQPVKYDLTDEFAFVNDLAFANGKLYIATRNGGLKVWENGTLSSVAIAGNSSINVTDIKINREGKVAVAYNAGSTFQVAVSPADNPTSFSVCPFSSSLIAADVVLGRIELAFGIKNPNMLYALAASEDGTLQGVYKANLENGQQFNVKMSSNTLYIGYYLNEAASIAVNDLEEEYVYVAGTNLFRLFNANNTDVFYAEEQTYYTADLESGSYVAPNIHAILFKENPVTTKDSLEMYLATDAGIFKYGEDINQNLGYTWRPVNKGISAQYYNVAVGADGSVMAAAQSNAINYIANPSLEAQKSADIIWSPMNAGYDYSRIQTNGSDVALAGSVNAQTGANVVGSAIYKTLPNIRKPFILSSSYMGLTRTYSNNNDYTEINDQTWTFGSGELMFMNNQLTSNIAYAPFITPMAYWETFNAPEDSRDSVRFTFVVAENNDESIDATRIVRGEEVLRLVAGMDLMEGDRVLVESNSLDYPFFYTLTSERFGQGSGNTLAFQPFEDTTIMVANPVQARLFVAAANGLFVCAEPMNFTKTVHLQGEGLKWARLYSVNGGLGQPMDFYRNPVRAIAPSPDGNSVLFSIDHLTDLSSHLVRVSGLNADSIDLINGPFTGANSDKNFFKVDTLGTFQRLISSISFEQNGDVAYITFAGLDHNTANIQRVNNVSGDAAAVTYEDVTLKDENNSSVKPVYTMLLDAFSQKAYVGTIDGMYETENRNATSINWTKVEQIPNTPIYDLYQQTANLPAMSFTTYLGNNATENLFEGTKYSGAIYAASYGKGLFMNRDNLQAAQDTIRVGLQDVVATAQTSVKLYPNPAASTTTLSYNLATSSNVTLSIYDMNGRLVSVLEKGSQSAGVHSQIIDLRSMDKGVYVIRIQTGHSVSTAKLIVQ